MDWYGDYVNLTENSPEAIEEAKKLLAYQVEATASHFGAQPQNTTFEVQDDIITDEEGNEVPITRVSWKAQFDLKQ